MNQRLTAAAAIAVILASASEFFLISGVAWLVTTIGAVTVVAMAGMLTRLAPWPAAIGATVLAALACVPVFATPGLPGKAASAAVVVCCAASGTRWRPLRVVAGLVTYLAALLLYLNAVRASALSLGLILPTKASLHHLLVLASNGMTEAKYAPPVTETPGIVLLAAGSIGLAAIVIDFLAVRLRRPAIAGLPLLVIYLAPLATAAHVQGPWGITAFLIAAAGYLGLLASDGRTRLRGWGRVISVWHRPGETERLGGADVAALSATGRRIGVAALCAAIIAPLLLPSLSLRHLFAPQPTEGGGPGVARLPDPVDQLHGMLTEARPQTVLTYRSDSVSGQYLQVYVLNYDQGQGKWTLVPPGPKVPVRSGTLLPPPGVASYMPQEVSTLHVSLLATTGYLSPLLFLPVPYSPVRLAIGGTWWESASTLMIFSGKSGQQAGSYTVTSGQVDPLPGLLDVPERVPAGLRPYVGFSSPATGRLRAIARQIVAGQHTAFGEAVALERWFHSGKFTYSVQSTIPNTPQGLLAFLTTDKQGYCQQFAFAMAVLARLLGIPSRIAIGYTPGTFQHGQGVVTTADAHAWPELYFPGGGWLRFEPTPGGTTGQGTAVEPAYVTTAPTTGPNPTGNHPRTTGPGAAHSPGSTIGNEHKLVGFNSSANDAFTPPPPHRKRSSVMPDVLIAVAALLLLGTVAPGTARILARRRRWRAASSDLGLARAAWREVRADLADIGIACLASDSPRAVARRVCAAVETDEAAQQAIARIAKVVERAYYAPAPASGSSLRDDVVTVRRSLARSVRWDVRWRARLFPASILEPTRTAVGHAIGVITGWVPVKREEAAVFSS